MAIPRKRNFNDNEDEEPAMQVTKKCKRTSKKTIIRKQLKEPVRAPRMSENLFMKLPGELRNVIYDLALQEDDTVVIRAPNGALRHYLYPGAPKPKSWREPGLLQVSKQIRKEASSVYYGLNHFEINLNTSILEQACTWIRQKHDFDVLDEEEGEALSFRLNFTSGTWRTLKSWIMLSKLFYDLRRVGDDYETYRESCKAAVPSYMLHGKLQEAALLGLKAKCRGLGYEELKIDFEEWASSTRRGRYLKRMHFDGYGDDDDDDDDA